MTVVTDRLRGLAAAGAIVVVATHDLDVADGLVTRVAIIREGKEPHQGVAYLDDGTMVVVEQARGVIGRTVEVVVTSVLQTTAGKMFFGRLAGSVPATEPLAAHGLDRTT